MLSSKTELILTDLAPPRKLGLILQGGSHMRGAFARLESCHIVQQQTAELLGGSAWHTLSFLRLNIKTESTE